MWSMLRQLLKILTPSNRKKLFGVFILVMIMALIESAGVISIMPFLAVLANPSVIESNRILQQLYVLLNAENNQKFIVYVGIISLVIVIFSTVFKIFTQYSLNKFSSLQRYELSSRLLNIYLQQKYEFFIKRNSATLVKNVLSETDQLIWSMIQPALVMISYGVVILAMTAILLIYDPLMAISIACILISFYLIIYWLIKRKLDQIGKDFAEVNKERYQSCQEALGGIKDVIINHAQQGYIDNFSHFSRVFAKNLATKDTLGQIPRYIIETVGYGCLIILAIVLAISGKDIAHILPMLGLYGFAAYRMLPAAQNIYQSITQIKFSEHIFERLKQEFALEQQNYNHILQPHPINFRREIRLENIRFAYPNRADDLILKDFNLIIKKNSSIGIVGKSGSGKSTLMDVMLGLLQPQQGKIFIDDVELTQKNIKAWQKIVGYVPQNIYLADKTIAENIAFGITEDKIDMVQVEHVAKQAQLHEFIMQQLPQGYGTMVGERGVMLSGGQKQRVGIARALYKNPQILFMDEATSALDVETEQAVNEAIQKLSGHKTMMIIAHRESAVAKCNRVFRLKA